MRVLFVHHEDPVTAGTYDEVVSGAGHEIVRWLPFKGEEPPPLDAIDAVVVLGGAVHPDADATDPWLEADVRLIEDALAAGVPTLGICLGAQLIARAAGSWVGPVDASEVGWYRIEPNEDGLDDPLVRELGPSTHGFQWHHYTFTVPDGATELARSDRAVQAFRLGECTWGVQFHPEVSEALVGEWIGMAPEQLDGSVASVTAETSARIADWSDTGRRLVLAFLAESERAALARA